MVSLATGMNGTKIASCDILRDGHKTSVLAAEWKYEVEAQSSYRDEFLTSIRKVQYIPYPRVTQNSHATESIRLLLDRNPLGVKLMLSVTNIPRWSRDEQVEEATVSTRLVQVGAG
jgi:hypothetical protein